MATQRFKKILLFRFIAYFAALSGLIFIVLELGPVLGAEFQFRKDNLLGVKYFLPPQVITSSGTIDATSQAREDNSGQSLDTVSQNSSASIIKPVSTDYGIVIEKINANARVIANVHPGDQNEYTQALSQGVAEASGSTPPGEPGNLFLFSHSTDAPWNIIRYNAIFFLLRELDKGDRAIIFYKGRRYDYIVYDRLVARANDVSYLNNRYDKPVLTLQTCDPPGTTLNRLIILAKLQSS